MAYRIIFEAKKIHMKIATLYYVGSWINFPMKLLSYSTFHSFYSSDAIFKSLPS